MIGLVPVDVLELALALVDLVVVGHANPAVVVAGEPAQHHVQVVVLEDARDCAIKYKRTLSPRVLNCFYD